MFRNVVYNVKNMSQPTISETNFKFSGQTTLYHGKVRDVYAINDKYLVAIASDRISAFDVILPRTIPFKGQVLNQLAAYFLESTADILPNWVLSVPDPNVTVGHKLEPFKIEMVVRGCLVGHAWREYSAGTRTLCGQNLPEGLQEYDRFPQPIITPSTKADAGHDEDIAHEEIIARGLATKQEFEHLSAYALELFARGQAMATERGLILADTKYEFGKLDDKIYAIDEIHTPDSSRYFYKDSFEAYLQDRASEPPRHLSKEFVREWLMANGFSGQVGQVVPEMSDEFVEAVSQRYIELFEQLTGQTFVPADDDDPLKRIEKNVTAALEKLQ